MKKRLRTPGLDIKKTTELTFSKHLKLNNNLRRTLKNMLTTLLNFNTYNSKHLQF